MCFSSAKARPPFVCNYFLNNAFPDPFSWFWNKIHICVWLVTEYEPTAAWIYYLHWAPILGCKLGITNIVLDPAQHLNFLLDLKYFHSCQKRLEFLHTWSALSPHQGSGAYASLQDRSEHYIWTCTNLETFMV